MLHKNNITKMVFPSISSFSFLFILAFFLLLTLYTTLHRPTTTATPSNKLHQNDRPHSLHYQNIFLSSASNYTLATYLRHLTLQPHLAGTPPSLQTTLYVKSHFEALGLETHVSNHTVLLSYPSFSSLTAHFSNGSSLDLPLSEPGFSGVVKAYHAYSPSGSALGQPVFLNYGREQDYIALRGLGVQFKGCIGIVRRGAGLSRNAAVEKAAAHGVAAVLMYTEGEKFAGVERGTVMKGLGDPLSPGWWAGVQGGERLRLNDPQLNERFPAIPSMPVSADTAEIILSSMEGAPLPQEWRENLKSNKIGRVGPGPVLLNFTYLGEKKMETIHNIFAVIRGSEEPDRFIILGNHRDAWTYGAVDPNSGTSALLEVGRRFALLMRLGWSPRRTIVFGSWDAEEFGMIGSTEWVEKNLVSLGSKAVAYLNVDCAVQGPGFFAGATPQLDDLLFEVTKKVKDPDSENISIFETCKVTNRAINIQRLSGVDSDFAPFLQHAGVPSIDLYYGRDFPVYHTAFDSYDWMVNFGDPLFQRHVAVSGVWGLLALRLADDPILPFNYLSYVAQLQEYRNALSNFLEGDISLNPITLAIQDFKAAADEIAEQVKKLSEDERMDEFSVLKKRMLNDRLMFAERGFLDAEGLQGLRWFKHLIYGPQIDGGSELNFFPGVVGAISRNTGMNKGERQEAIQHEVWRVARAIERAACALKGSLT
ncbi:probable glutamate carboxypeptidase AMP1 isoform X3 [Coffea arabica]|uniref:Probable glutamate carboxypeptidase AMP1 isoform X3 n=1 Tax=Coffea arabica TaxID=13443 RepID=A0ABM4UU77_COFAR